MRGSGLEGNNIHRAQEIYWGVNNYFVWMLGYIYGILVIIDVSFLVHNKYTILLPAISNEQLMNEKR